MSLIESAHADEAFRGVAEDGINKYLDLIAVGLEHNSTSEKSKRVEKLSGLLDQRGAFGHMLRLVGDEVAVDEFQQAAGDEAGSRLGNIEAVAVCRYKIVRHLIYL